MVDIIDCLPTLPTAFVATALAKSSSSFPSDDVFLGETPTWMFGEANASGFEVPAKIERY